MHKHEPKLNEPTEPFGHEPPEPKPAPTPVPHIPKPATGPKGHRDESR
jgi:hypothetical protein